MWLKIEIIIKKIDLIQLFTFNIPYVGYKIPSILLYTIKTHIDQSVHPLIIKSSLYYL